MNKSDLIKQIAEKTEMSASATQQFLNAFTEVVTDTLKDGDTIAMVGFGTFSTKKRNARVGRNPQTGVEMQIPESIVPSFKAGKLLKDACNS